MQPIVRRFAFVLFVASGAVCLWQAISGPSSSQSVAATPPSIPLQAKNVARDAHASSRRAITTPIQDLRVGMRVVGKNPIASDAQRKLPEPNPKTWRLIRARIEMSPGKFCQVELLRPMEWIRHVATQLRTTRTRQVKYESNEVTLCVGDEFWLELPEMRQAGFATLTDVAPCPSIEEGVSPLITGTFRHVNESLLELSIEGVEDPIRCTDKHPFWSATQHGFVAAVDLTVGEQVLTAYGNCAKISSIEPRAGPEVVYGLEVFGEHVYSVSHRGLLVHNASLEERIKATPTENTNRAHTGKWTGLRGRSTFELDNTPANQAAIKLLAYHGHKGVSYRNGKIVLSPYAVGKIKISRAKFDELVAMSGDERSALHAYADELLANQWQKQGIKITAADIKALRQGKEGTLTWHEHNDKQSLYLVPYELNAYFGHLGGIAE